MSEEVKEIEMYSYIANGKRLWTSNEIFAQIRANFYGSDTVFVDTIATPVIESARPSANQSAPRPGAITRFRAPVITTIAANRPLKLNDVEGADGEEPAGMSTVCQQSP